MKMTSSCKKNETNISALKPKLSFSSNNVSNIWETDAVLYPNNEYNQNYNSECHQNINNNNLYMNYVTDEKAPNSFYHQNMYPKTSSNLPLHNIPYSYSPYSAFYMSPNNLHFQNYPFYSNHKPDYFANNEDGYELGNRPHFFSQTHINLDEKKSFFNNNLQKKATPKKNSLVMKNNPYSSPSNTFEWDIDLYGDSKVLFETCKDQLGSRKIQNFFEKAGEDEKEIMFKKVEPQLLFLIKDQFGNYVVQKILEKGFFFVILSSFLNF